MKSCSLVEIYECFKDVAAPIFTVQRNPRGKKKIHIWGQGDPVDEPSGYSSLKHGDCFQKDALFYLGHLTFLRYVTPVTIIFG
jgi:hypothetical protein